MDVESYTRKTQLEDCSTPLATISKKNPPDDHFFMIIYLSEFPNVWSSPSNWNDAAVSTAPGNYMYRHHVNYTSNTWNLYSRMEGKPAIQLLPVPWRAYQALGRHTTAIFGAPSLDPSSSSSVSASVPFEWNPSAGCGWASGMGSSSTRAGAISSGIGLTRWRC